MSCFNCHPIRPASISIKSNEERSDWQLFYHHLLEQRIIEIVQQVGKRHTPNMRTDDQTAKPLCATCEPFSGKLAMICVYGCVRLICR